MIFENSKIYDIATKANKFYKDNSVHFPVTLGFYLFKNLKIFIEAAKDIDEMKRGIISNHGIISDENGKYEIPKDLILTIQEELLELSHLTQDLNIHIFKLEDFKDMKLTAEQLEILIEMIEEPQDEDE